MDDVFVRSRYPRRNTRSKKRKSTRYNSLKYNNSPAATIIRQLIASILILLVIALIKGIQVPFTQKLSDKIKYIVTENIDFEKIYNKVDVIVARITNREKNEIQQNFTENSNNAQTNQNNQNADTADYIEPVVAGEMYTSDGILVSNPEIDVRLIAPVEGTVSSPFGERIHPIRKTVEFHKGVDIEAAEGTQIRAVLDGEIVEAGEEPTYGKYIKIAHADGITTVYAHCSKLIGKKGQIVKQGDVIAEVGDTGVAVGSHLHFELWKDGKLLDPSNYLEDLKSL